MAVVALASWAAKQGNGFATDEITGAITGIGDYRRALVQAGAAVLGIVIALLLSCIDYRSLCQGVAGACSPDMGSGAAHTVHRNVPSAADHRLQRR